MRTLSSLAQSEAARQGQDAVWVLSIYWADGVRHYAHREITLSDASVSCSLLTPGKLTQTTPDPVIPAVRIGTSRLEISLALDDTERGSVRLYMESQSPEGLEVDWGLILLDENGAAQLSDRIPFFWGVIDKATVSRFALELDCVDALSARCIRRFGNELTSFEIPEEHGDAEGKMLSVVFGTPGQVALLPWRTGVLFYLSKAVAATDTVIGVTFTDDLPDSGSVQIGEEVLTYTAVDRVNHTLGTSAAPLSRPEAAAHLSSAVGRTIPSVGFQWVVAQHACRAVRNVDSSGDLIATSLWTTTTEVWNSKTLQKVALSRWPGQAGVAHVFSAEVEGLEENSVLLENPANIIRHFLVSSDAMGWETSRLDSASFSEVAATLDTLGYRLSNVLATPKTVRVILERLLLESRCLLICSAGRIALRFESTVASTVSSDFTFNQDNILRGEELQLERAANSKLLSGIHLRYGCDFSSSTSLSNYRHYLFSSEVSPLETDGDTGIDVSLKLHWHNHGVLAVVSDLADFLIARHGFRTETLTLHVPFCAAALEVHDRVSVQEALFPLALDAGRIQSVAVPEPHLLQYRVMFSIFGVVCWEYNTGTLLRHRVSESLLEIWINGNLVSTVAWNGVWKLSGAVREDCVFTYAVTEKITYDASSKMLYFSSGVSNNYTPRFALDAAGNLLVAGIVREDMLRSDLTLGSCIEATAAYFAKGLFETTPIFVFDVSSRCLQVRGSLVEEATLG